MANNLPALLNSDVIKNRFNEVLGKKSAGFMSALLNIYNGNAALQNCEALSILGAAGLAATLDLSITPSLGQAYIVPFKGKATFQIGVRGLIQLAHRTGKYEAIHAGAIREGELRGFNPITGEPITGDKISDEIIGYVAYMRLINGFEKTLYMTVSEIEAHAQRHSQSYGKNYSPWTTNFEAMASKTVLKKLLNTWGILSADMAEAIQGDQSVVDRNTFTYVDNKGDIQTRDQLYIPESTETPIDFETGEVLETVAAEVQA